MAAIPAHPLVLITDRTILAPNWTLSQAIAPCVTGGVNMVIFREVEIPNNPRLTMARFVKDGIVSRALFIVSGTAQFVIDAGADGLLIEDQSVFVEDARKALGPDRVIGIAVTSIEALRAAHCEGADFALLNLDWTNPEAALDLLCRFHAIASIPIITGVDMEVEVVTRCLDAGAAGIAICAPGMSAYDRTNAVRGYAAAIQPSHHL